MRGVYNILCLITVYLYCFFSHIILLNRKLQIKKLLLYPGIAVRCASVTDVFWHQGHVVWSGDGVSVASCFGIWPITTRCPGSRERCGDETSADSWPTSVLAIQHQISDDHMMITVWFDLLWTDKYPTHLNNDPYVNSCVTSSGHAMKDDVHRLSIVL